MSYPKIIGIIFILFIFSGLILAQEPAKEEPTEIEEIVVTATKTKRPIEDVPVSVSVITSEDIEKSGAHNIDDLFRLEAGLDLKRIVGVGSAGSAMPVRISVRGIPGPNRVLVLVDGLPLNGSGTGFVNLNEIPMQNIERVEIVRGPFSSLYGSNAGSGVINIITKETQPNGVFYEAGNESYSHTGAYGGYNSDSFSFSLSADMREIDNFLARDYIIRRSWDAGLGQFVTTREPETNHGYEDRRINGRLLYNINEKSILTLFTRYFDNKLGFGQTSYLATQKDIDIESRMTLFALTFETEISGRFPFVVSAYSRRNKTGFWNEAFSHTVPNPSPPPPSFPVYVRSYDKSRYDDWNLSLQVSGDLNEQHKITLGLENIWNYGESDPTENVTTGQPLDPSATEMDEHINNFGLFVQDEIALSKEINLVPAVRFDRHSEFGSAVSPKLGLLYKLSQDTRFHVSAGRAFQAPTITQLFAPDIPTPGVTLKSNPDLEPEYITSYELGGEHNIMETLTARVNLFHNQMDDLISYKTLPGSIRQYDNIDEAKSMGVESALDWQVMDGITGFVNHTYQDTEDEETDRELGYMPRNKSNFGLKADRKFGDIKVSGSVVESYVGQRDYDDWQSGQTNTLPGYWKADLNVMVQYKQNTSLRLGVQNLTDKKYEDTGGYLAPGRLYYFGLNVKF